jgi:cell division protein FtsI/penicillin-binding protein 2
MLWSSCTTSAKLRSALHSDPIIHKVLSNPDYEAQILYTHVDLKDTSCTSYKIQIQDKYFYPASTVKMPVAILALQYINELNEQGIDIKPTDALVQYAQRPEQSDAIVDSTTTDKRPSIERYIEKIFAVSDNDAYNRLYEFLGPDYINQSLKKIGVFSTSTISHRVGVGGYNPEDNRHTTSSYVYRRDSILMHKEMNRSQVLWKHDRKGSLKGIGYLNNKDSLVTTPFDFSQKNYYSIRDMEATLKRIILPNKYPKEQRFFLKEKDYNFLRKSLSSYPDTYDYYRDNSEYYDTYVKFLFYGSDPKEITNDEITIYNKVGNAYGYLIDCAYFENRAENIAFFLTAVIHVNANKIYNDGIYEYDEIGYPYFKQLGRVIYEFDKKKSSK